ncbi:MAG TPA: hypothetical protein VF450_23705 [Noviherbaspirillum sp.]
MNPASISLRRARAPQSAAATISDFDRIMAAVFALTGQKPAMDERRQAYRVRIDSTLELNLFPDPKGNLVMIGNCAPLVAQIGAEHLLRVMQLNSYFPSAHQVTVGFIHSNRTMQVWSRYPMHRMKDREVVRMLKLMANAVSHVNAILAESDHRT